MNIGLVTTWFERGAAYVSRQYQQVLAQEHTVFIYARSGESYAVGNPDWDNPFVTWGKYVKYGVHTAVDLPDFKQWLLNNQIELLIFNEQWWWPPVLLCNELGIKTGAYVDYYTETTVPFFNAYDFLLCNTKRHLSAFDWHPKVFYIPWGTDIELFTPRTLQPVKTDNVTFFHSAGMSPTRKGTDFVIEAFAALNSKVAHLIIHSQAMLSEKLPAQRAKITLLLKEKRLTIYEETVPAPGLYHLGDVYLYPSRLEGIGLTIAEALACGLPVITTDNAPMNEFVREEANGRLVKIDRFIARADGYYWPQALVNVQSLQAQMQYYLDRVDILSDKKKAARVYAETNLAWDTNAAILNTLVSTVQKRPLSTIVATIASIERFEATRNNIFHRHPKLIYWVTKLYAPFKHIIKKYG